jgi:hypothetical protein
MRAVRFVAVVALVSWSSLFAASTARADDPDPVKAVETAFRKVNDCIHDHLPTAAQAALAEAETQLATLDDFHKEKVAQEAERARTGLKALLANANAEQLKAVVANTVERAQMSVQRNIGDGRNVYHEYSEAVKLFQDQTSDELNKKLLDPGMVAELQKKLDGIKVDFQKARIREAVNAWEQDENIVVHERGEGPEKDTKPYEISRVVVGWEMGCERTAKFIDRIDGWLASWKTTIDANPDDPTLKKLCADLETKRTAAQAKIAEFRKAVFAEAEKLPPGEQRDTMDRLYHSFLKAGADDGAPTKGKKGGKGERRKGAGVGPGPGDEDLVPKITALLDRWDAEKGKSKSEKESLIKDLIASSDARWPGMLKSWSPVKLETSEILKDVGKWKGKAGKIIGDNYSGGAYENQYGVIVEVDGVPVCGDFDDGLATSFNTFVAFAEKNALKLGAVQEWVGIVDGTCKVWQRVKRGDRIVRGDQIDGIRVRIVGLKTERFAGAAGQGSSFDSVGSGGGGGSGGSESGLWHIIHRFLAWGMCLLLGLGGLLALGHGASRFVPQIEEQKVKLGSGLGYAGIAFAVLGVLWFLGAIALSFFGLCRFGSLPSVALIFAGIVTGLDLLRIRGTLKEETARLIQPVGILFGLGCFGAAAAHFLFWDKVLL